MLCLSDIQLFLLLLWKMAPWWVRKGYGSVPLAAGKKVLVLDYAPVWLTVFSPASVAIMSLSDSPLFALWVSSAIACGLVFQPDQATVKFAGQLAPQLLWASQTPLRFCLVFYPNPGQIWLSSSLSQTLLQAHQPSTQLCLGHAAPLRGIWKLLGLTQVAPNPAATQKNQTPSANHAAPSNCTPRWPPPKTGAVQPLRWALSRVPNPKQWPPPKILHNLTKPPPYSVLIPSWRVLGTFSFSCFSPLSSFQSPRPEERMFLFLPLPVCPGLLLSNLGQKRWVPSSSLLFLLLFDSALWLVLNSQWGGQERERLKNNLT